MTFDEVVEDYRSAMYFARESGSSVNRESHAKVAQAAAAMAQVIAQREGANAIIEMQSQALKELTKERE